MKEKLVTIVIPVYNSEKYLDDCIESVVNQSYKNIEILLINDGSTDNSKKICEKWSIIDKRIKIYNKKNSGAAESRNVGIEHSKGDYITFIDSDDYIETDLIEKCVKSIFTKNTIVMYGLKNVDEVIKFLMVINLNLIKKKLWNFYCQNFYIQKIKKYVIIKFLLVCAIFILPI